MKLYFVMPTYLEEEPLVRACRELINSEYFSGMELRGEPEFLLDRDSSYRRAIYRVLWAHPCNNISLHLSSHLPYCSPVSEIEDVAMRVLSESINVGRDLGVINFVLHPPGLPYENCIKGTRTGDDYSFRDAMLGKRDDLVEKMLFNLNRLSEGLGEHRKIVVENCTLPSMLCTTASDTIKILTRSGNEKIGATLDLGHAGIVGLDTELEVSTLARRLSHVHIHDNFGVYDLHLAVDKGNLNWRRSLECLHAVNYDGPIVIESWWKTSEELLENGKKVFDFWNSLSSKEMEGTGKEVAHGSV